MKTLQLSAVVMEQLFVLGLECQTKNIWNSCRKVSTVSRARGITLGQQSCIAADADAIPMYIYGNPCIC